MKWSPCGLPMLMRMGSFSHDVHQNPQDINIKTSKQHIVILFWVMSWICERLTSIVGVARADTDGVVVPV